MSHYVYILRCCDGSLYTGYSTDPERRLKEHQEGNGARYTRGRRPVKLLAFLNLTRGRKPWRPKQPSNGAVTKRSWQY